MEQSPSLVGFRAGRGEGGGIEVMDDLRKLAERAEENGGQEKTKEVEAGG